MSLYDKSSPKPRSASKAAQASAAVKRAAPHPHFRIGFLVHDVSRMRRTLLDQAFKPLGITRAQWWVLGNLSRQETEGMIQSDMARLLDVGKVTIGGLIDRLEASGHVERRADPVDRRVKRIFITPRGYEVIEQMTAVLRQVNGLILKDIPLDKLHIAEEVMHQMKENTREALGPQPRNGGAPDDEG